MNWPQIPQTFTGLTAAELRNFAKQIRDARAANVGALTTAEDVKAYDDFEALQHRVERLADEKETEEAGVAAAEVAQAAEAQAAAEAEAATAQAEADEAAAAEAQAAAEAAAATEAANATAPVVTTMAVEGTERTVVTAAEVTVLPWRATGRVEGMTAGEHFADHRELANAFIALADVVDAGTNERFKIAQLPAARPLRELSDNVFANLELFDSSEEITAAMCPPLTPLYDLACDNRVDRPVRDGLPQFRLPATRGGFKVLESPSLTDISGGYGQWTSADDTDPEAIKEACQTITCSTTTDYEIYAIYRCLTVKQMVNMTFPELVAAYLNRLHAATSRYAEVLLLEQMANGSDTIDATRRLGYGAATSILTVVLNYLALYQEIERWDVATMDAWMPRWLKWAIKTDLMRRRRTDGGFNLVPSDAEVDRLFADVGVTPHWYIDRPSWATPIPTLATSGDLNFFPSSVEILIHRRGKFALMDRGELTIGVGGNKMYLEDDVKRNQFTMFFESFEGIIDTDSCPAHILQIPGLCFNGAQIADVVIACEGQDVVGVGS